MKKDYIIFVDTDMDFTPELCEKYDFKLISMPYSFNKDEMIYPYVDFKEFDSHSYFERLRKGEMPTTNTLNAEEYEKYFEPYAQKSIPILYVHFSRVLSATFNAMNVAVINLKEKYKDFEFYEIDTRGITICSYAIACEIGEMYKKGKSIKQIIEWADIEVDKFATYFFADNLSFFRRSGRVLTLNALVGNMLGIRPIMYMSKEGELRAIDRARGQTNAVSKIVKYVANLQDNIENHKVIIGHTDNTKLRDLVIVKLREIFEGKLDIESVVINPTIGAHCGPDALGVCFHAKNR